MSNNFTEESAAKLMKAAEELRENVQEFKAATANFKDLVAPEGIKMVDDSASDLERMATEAMGPTFLAAADTIEKTAKVTLATLRAAGNL